MVQCCLTCTVMLSDGTVITSLPTTVSTFLHSKCCHQGGAIIIFGFVLRVEVLPSCHCDILLDTKSTYSCRLEGQVYVIFYLKGSLCASPTWLWRRWSSTIRTLQRLNNSWRILSTWLSAADALLLFIDNADAAAVTHVREQVVLKVGIPTGSRALSRLREMAGQLSQMGGNKPNLTQEQSPSRSVSGPQPCQPILAKQLRLEGQHTSLYLDTIHIIPDSRPKHAKLCPIP